MSLHTLLILGALLCFGLAAVGVPAKGVNLTAAGLFLYVLAALI